MSPDIADISSSRAQKSGITTATTRPAVFPRNPGVCQELWNLPPAVCSDLPTRSTREALLVSSKERGTGAVARTQAQPKI